MVNIDVPFFYYPLAFSVVSQTLVPFPRLSRDGGRWSYSRRVDLTESRGTTKPRKST